MAYPPRRPFGRPIGVWLICACFMLSASFTLFAFASYFGGGMPLNTAQSAYFASLGAIDWLLSIGVGVCTLAGAILLFMLRKVSGVLFALALALNIAMALYQAATTNWIDAIGKPGLIGAMIGWGVLFLVVEYSRRLANEGVLR